MTLRYNDKDGSFVLITNDIGKAEKAGLTLSKTAHGPKGESVYFTADYAKKPVYNPYAVLDWFEEGDVAAKTKLAPFYVDYKESWRTSDNVNIPKPDNGMDYLPFQKAGIDFGSRKRNVLIGDDMGLGKTVQAIGICNQNEGKRNLVICPASIRLNWARMVEKWSSIPQVSSKPILTAKHGIGDQNGNEKTALKNYTIVSYDITRNDGIHGAICDNNWDNVILDEAHFLKTIDANRTQAIFGTNSPGTRYFNDFIAKKAGKLIALTGTPLLNRPKECYTLARALCWDSIDWDSYERFCFRYNPSGQMDNGGTLEKVGRLSELQARLRCNFMIRRLKQDVLTELPDKRYSFSYIEPNGAISEVLKREKLIHFDISELKNPFSELMGMISTIRREMGEAKAPRVVEHMKYLLDIEEIPKVVLFAHHKSVMDVFLEKLQGYGIVQVRGAISPIAKQKAIDGFVHDPKIRIFMGQLDAAGFGIDGLQSVSSRVVFAEPAWSPGVNEQAIDRLHRIGQHENVLAEFLVVAGSLDERVLAAVLDKSQTIYEALDRRMFDAIGHATW